MKSIKQKKCCQINAQKKRFKTLKKVEFALIVLSKKKTTITLAQLAKAANVSLVWFYKEKLFIEYLKQRFTSSYFEQLLGIIRIEISILKDL